MGRQIKTGSQMYQIIMCRCGNDQIRSLLRKYKKKAPKKIRITAINKEELIANLKASVEKKVIPLNDVYRLIQDSEENGNQHIFYFKPRTEAIGRRYSRGQRIADYLWGRNWKSQMLFPVFTWIPDRETWSDFRPQDVNSKKSDWLAKIYWVDKHLRYLGQGRHGSEVTKSFREEKERVVVVVRWNSPDLLEIRIERSKYTSRAAVEKKLRALFNKISQALNVKDFKPWDLGPVRRNLLADEEENRKIYALGDTTFTDSHSGGAAFFPQTEEENLFSTLERREAIKIYMERKCSCRDLIVTWRSDGSSGILEKDLRTIMGVKTNEVIIQSRISPEAVDYVTNKFRDFNKY